MSLICVNKRLVKSDKKSAKAERNTKIKMDQSLTSPKSTPFSINDILTKNNTTILRRNSCGHLSPVDKTFVHEKDCAKMQQPSDDLPLQLTNSMHFHKYSPQRYENDSNMDQSFHLNHRSSPNYLCNNNINKMHNATEVRNERNAEKTMKKPLRFYNFPLMLERPLDMRLCADEDDSGEKLNTIKMINKNIFPIEKWKEKP